MLTIMTMKVHFIYQPIHSDDTVQVGKSSVVPDELGRVLTFGWSEITNCVHKAGISH